MKPGFVISILGHLAVGASGLVFLGSAPTSDPVIITEISLEGLEIGAVRNLTEVAEETPPEEPEEIAEDSVENDLPVEEEPALDPSPPEAAEEALPEESPDALPEFEEDEIPEETAEPEEIEPEPTPSPTPTENVRKYPPKEPTLDDLFDQTDSLLNDKSETTSARQRSQARNELEDLSDQPTRRPSGEGTGNTALVVDWLRAEIKAENCWRSVSDLPDWERLDVTIRFRLDARGNITQGPRRLRPRNISLTDQYLNIASDRALRAIRSCAPFSLPSDQYGLWQNKDIDLTFDEQF